MPKPPSASRIISRASDIGNEIRQDGGVHDRWLPGPVGSRTGRRGSAPEARRRTRTAAPPASPVPPGGDQFASERLGEHGLGQTVRPGGSGSDTTTGSVRSDRCRARAILCSRSAPLSIGWLVSRHFSDSRPELAHRGRIGGNASGPPRSPTPRATRSRRSCGTAPAVQHVQRGRPLQKPLRRGALVLLMVVRGRPRGASGPRSPSQQPRRPSTLRIDCGASPATGGRCSGGRA